MGGKIVRGGRMQRYITIIYANGNGRVYKIPQEVEKSYCFTYYTTDDNIAAGMRYLFRNKFRKNG